MDQEIDFTPLLLVSALAFLIPLVTHRLSGGRMPSVVGEILAGIIFGSTAAGVIEANIWLEFLSLFGFAYLMFLAGLEIDTKLLVRPLGSNWYRPSVALQHPLVAGVLLLGLFVATSAGGVVGLHAIDLADDVPLLLFVLAATAVGVLAPVLKDRDNLGSYVQVLLVAGFLVEFTAIVAIGIIAAIDRAGLGIEALLLLVLPAAFAFLLFAASQGKARFPGLVRLLSILAHSSSQIRIRGALTLLVIFVVLSQVVGTELVLGAFFAGLALTILSPRQGSSMRVKLDALGYGFFVPIFFITTGATLDLGALGKSADAALLIPAFLAVGLVGKLLPALLFLWPGFGLRRALAGGTLLSANLSIILAAVTVAQESGRFDEATTAALLVLALVSTAVAPLGFGFLLPRKRREVVGRAIVIGATTTGVNLASRLHRAGLTVIVVDRKEEELVELRELGCETITGDALHPETLSQAQPQSAEVAVIAVNDAELVVDLAQRLRDLAGDLRIVTWMRDPDPRLSALDVEAYSVGEATALALEGAVLRPTLFQALGGGEGGFLQEVMVRSKSVVGIPLQQLPIAGGVRIILLLREGVLIIPEADTELLLLDRVLLGGEPSAVEEVFSWLGDRDLRAGPVVSDSKNFTQTNVDPRSSTSPRD